MAVASPRGAALIELVPAIALAALVSATTIPVVAGTLEHERVRIAAHYVAARLMHAQLEALRRGASVALRVDVAASDASLQLFVDGNGNGVRTRDIEQGVDPPIGPADSIGAHASGVTLRVNQRVLDAGGSAWLEAGADPLRIGNTALISCSPTGSLTSGTLYISAARGPQAAVRITGTTGRVRVLGYDAASATWRP